MRLLEREGEAPAAGLLEPTGEAAECGTIYARICDAACAKPWAQAPIGSCSGLCKTSGDVHGNHSGNHTCNTCGYSWS